MKKAPKSLRLVSEAFATGWYVVSWSSDLIQSQVKPLKYFGKHYVLYRSEEGRAFLLDAHCPHMGAHLGYGGRVAGEELVCPFHAWQFASNGKCMSIPYATKIPPRACVRAYQLSEHSGMIFAFFGPENAVPDYVVPPLDALGAPGWTPLAMREIEIATQPREVVENIADRAHFFPVHNQKVDEFEVVVDGPRATQITVGTGRNLEGVRIKVVTTATYHGPAVQFTDLIWAYPMLLINAHIPIDHNRLLLRFGVSLYAGPGVELSQAVIDAHVAAARDGYFQDVKIWENKRWRDSPSLADGDGPIMKIRKWYAAFLPAADTTGATPPVGGRTRKPGKVSARRLRTQTVT